MAALRCLKVALLLVDLIFNGCSMAQEIKVSSTANTSDKNYIELYKVDITNKTRGWTETIFYPDTVYPLYDGVGIELHNDIENLVLFQNSPNPFTGKTNVGLRLL